MKPYIDLHKKIALSIPCLLIFCLSAFAQLRPISMIDTESEYNVTYADFSPDGKRLIIGGGATELWDVQTGKRLLNLEHPTGEGFMKGVSVSVKFSPDGKYVVVGYPASQRGWGDAILWDVTSGAIVQTFRINKGMYVYDFPSDYETKGIGFNLKEDKLYTVTPFGTLREWDTKTGKELKRFETRGSSPFAIFPDGKRCVAKRGVYSLEDGSELLLVEGRLFLKDNLYHYLLPVQNGDGTKNRQINQLDPKTYEIIKEFPSFISQESLLTLSRNGTYALTSGGRIFSISNSKELTKISTRLADSDQETTINNVVFSSDDRTMAALSGSKVYIYDVSDLTSSVKEAEALGR